MLFHDFVQKTLVKKHPLLLEFYRAIIPMTIIERSLVLKMVQLGYSHDIHNNPTAPFIELRRSHFATAFPAALRAIQHICSSFEDSYFHRSMCWALLLQTNVDATQGQEMVKSNLVKEVTASQSLTSLESRMNYDSFHNVFDSEVHPSFRKTAQTFLDRAVRLCQRRRILYPQYQKRKNTSQESAYLYCQRYPDVNLSEVTTLHLEKHNLATGEKIQGRSEMRQVWRYNELKPRLYYCAGGDQYWTSRYAKSIAVDFMDSLESTSTDTRTHPADFLSGRQPPAKVHDQVAFWDYSSFTTRFSELRHFLHEVANLLEDNPVDEQYPLRLFDPWEGVIEIRLSDFLRQYNEVVNVFAGFSLHRLVHLLDLEDPPIDLVQMNSGMLGVHGNIGFSTTLHGLIAASCVGSDSTVCVGDDAVAIVPKSAIVDDLFERLECFGQIARDKCDVLTIVRGEVKSARFLKRCCSIDEEGCMTLDSMLKLPSLLSACSDIRPGRVTLFKDDEDRLYKISSQVATLLWSIKGFFSDMSDEDQAAYVETCKSIYRQVELPLNGAFSGTWLPSTSSRPSVRVFYHIPPISHDFDYRVGDWTDLLWSTRPQDSFLCPRLVDATITLNGIGLGRYVATSSKPLNMLVDLEKAKRKVVMDEIDVEDVGSRERYQRVFRQGLRQVYEYEILSVPDVFVQCFEDGSYSSQGLEHVYMEYL